MTFKKTRIAPTPSGFLHLGNVMSFLITAALARQNGAAILLRIDDIDQERVKKKYVEDIFKSLSFMEIPWDEGPRNYQEYKSTYSQTHRMEFYEKAIDHLKNTKRLFACDCSRRKINRESPDGSYPGTCRSKNIPFDNKEANWRLKTDDNKIIIKHLSGREITSTIPPLLKDFVVRRKDGLPSYQLTSAVDDMLDGVDLIIRGNDLKGSSIAQQFLSRKLPDSAHPKPVHFHHILMTDAKNRKMSKSSGSTSIQHLARTGADKAGIYRMIGDFLKLEGPVGNFEEFQKAYHAAWIVRSERP